MAGPHLAEGFDDLTTADLSLYYTLHNSPAVVADGGRGGVNALEAGAQDWITAVTPRLTSFVMGVAVWLDPAGDGQNIHLALVTDGTAGAGIGSLWVNPDRSISVRVGTSDLHNLFGLGTVVWTSAPNKMRFGTWTEIQWKEVLHASAGTYALKVNGELLVTATGVATLTGGATALSLATIGSGVSTYGARFKDWWIADLSGAAPNDFLDARVVESQVAAAGNGAHAEFTPSTGSDHGAMVDDPTSDGDATYNRSVAPGARDTYSFPALTRVDSVDAQRFTFVARKDATGTRALAGLTHVGGTDTVDGTDQYLSEAYAPYGVALPLNPTTAAAWTLAQANATDLGVQVTV